MIKILHVSQLGGGGRERRMVQLVRGLDATGNYEQTIITFKSEIGYKEVLETKAKIYPVTSRNKRDMWRQICSILSEVRPNIVHVWEEEPRQVLPVLWMKHKLHYKFIAGFVSEGNYVRPWSKVDLANKLYFSFADTIISNSRAGLIAKRAPKFKSNVVYNGFDFNRLSKQVDARKKRDEVGIKSRYVVMMCARFTTAKDYDSYLKIAELAQNNNIPATFLAVGIGPLYDVSRQKAGEMKLMNVKYLGRRTDVEELLRITDVSMLLTNASVHAEGVSNSIMESMAAGVPVIATNGGGTPEIIIDKENGYMVQPNDYQTAYQLLVQLLENSELRRSIGQSSTEQIKTKFLLSNMTVQYIDIYNKLLAK